jgi:iron complex outermembrane recepter protein
VRISGATRDQDGWVNGINGSESNSRDRALLRGQALWDTGTFGELRVIADWAEGDDECGVRSGRLVAGWRRAECRTPGASGL